MFVCIQEPLTSCFNHDVNCSYLQVSSSYFTAEEDSGVPDLTSKQDADDDIHVDPVFNHNQLGSASGASGEVALNEAVKRPAAIMQSPVQPQVRSFL